MALGQCEFHQVSNHKCALSCDCHLRKTQEHSLERDLLLMTPAGSLATFIIADISGDTHSFSLSKMFTSSMLVVAC